MCTEVVSKKKVFQKLVRNRIAQAKRILADKLKKTKALDHATVASATVTVLTILTSPTTVHAPYPPTVPAYSAKTLNLFPVEAATLAKHNKACTVHIPASPSPSRPNHSGTTFNANAHGDFASPSPDASAKTGQ